MRAAYVDACIMRISVGHISARCEHCGGEEFQPVPGENSAPLELVCSGCGQRTAHRALLMQVANETVRRAQAFLEQARKQRERPR
jgi:hypothetical protein